MIEATQRLPSTRILVLALAIGSMASGGAFAQSTTGTIFGQVAASGGETVLIENANGFKREVGVDERGRYVASQLPLGTYTVSLRRNGQTVDARKQIALQVGAGTDVSFTGGAAAGKQATNLGAVTVVGNALPAIDVTSVDSRTVITAEQLAKLPLARSAEAVAMLAPGVNRNSAN